MTNKTGKRPNLRGAAFGANDLPVFPVVHESNSRVAAPVVSANSTQLHKNEEVSTAVLSAEPSSTHTDDPDVPAVVRLKTGILTVWSGNPRHVIDDEGLDELMKDIRANGQLHPIDVIEDHENPGHYLIIGGQRRWLAMKIGELNDGFILARIRTDLKTEEAILGAALMPQMLTEPLQDIDLAISIARKSDEIGIRVMARALGKNAGELSKLRQIGELPDAILEFFKIAAGKFRVAFGYEVVAVHKALGTDVALSFAREIRDSDLTVKRTNARRLELIAGAGNDKPQKSKRKSWDTKHFSQYNGSLKSRESSGDLELKLTALTPELMQQISDAVNRIIG